MGERDTVSGAGRELRTHHSLPVATSGVRYTRSRFRRSEHLSSPDRRDPLDSDGCLPAGHVRSAVRESSRRLPGGVGAMQSGEDSACNGCGKFPASCLCGDIPAPERQPGREGGASWRRSACARPETCMRPWAGSSPSRLDEGATRSAYWCRPRLCRGHRVRASGCPGNPSDAAVRGTWSRGVLTLPEPGDEVDVHRG